MWLWSLDTGRPFYLFPFLPWKLIGRWLVQRLEFYYIINYYFKYLELIDTVFLALKKKPLGQLKWFIILDYL